MPGAVADGAVAGRDPLAETLADHQPAGPEEAEHLERIRAFAERKQAPFDRTDPEGHLVASGLVASPDLDRVVLLHHRQLGMWLQPGGHAEAEERRPRAIALREAREETGLPVEPHPLWEGLVDVDVHEIPAAEEMPAHEHLDLRYLLVADPSDEPAAPPEEAREVRWFDVDEARRKLELDEGLQRLLWKVRSIRVDAGLDRATERVQPTEGTEP